MARSHSRTMAELDLELDCVPIYNIRGSTGWSAASCLANCSPRKIQVVPPASRKSSLIPHPTKIDLTSTRPLFL